MKHELLWLVGGLCVGAGIVTGITGGFGVSCGDIAVCFSQLGTMAWTTFGHWPGRRRDRAGALGIGCLVEANRTAWQRTGGY